VEKWSKEMSERQLEHAKIRSETCVFPIQVCEAEGAAVGNNGITKRELFAAMAMHRMATKDQGEYSQADLDRKNHLQHPEWVATSAVNYADALLAELKKTDKADACSNVET
jgi:hypothetical protein